MQGAGTTVGLTPLALDLSGITVLCDLMPRDLKMASFILSDFFSVTSVTANPVSLSLAWLNVEIICLFFNGNEINFKNYPQRRVTTVSVDLGPNPDFSKETLFYKLALDLINMLDTYKTKQANTFKSNPYKVKAKTKQLTVYQVDGRTTERNDFKHALVGCR